MHGIIQLAGYASFGAIALGSRPAALAQGRPANAPTEEQLAQDNKLFLSLARKALKWEEPAEPVRIAGPIYFVGTRDSAPFSSPRLKGTS